MPFLDVGRDFSLEKTEALNVRFYGRPPLRARQFSVPPQKSCKEPLSDEKAFQSDGQLVLESVDKVYEPGVTPLKHAAVGHEEVSHAYLQIGPGSTHHPLVCLSRVIPYVFIAPGAGVQGSCDAPGDDSVLIVNVHSDAAMGDGATARHAHGPSDQNVPFLDVKLFGQRRVMRYDDLSGSRVSRKGVENKIIVAAERILPGQGDVGDALFASLAEEPRRLRSLHGWFHGLLAQVNTLLQVLGLR
jgi:hypothetical protein